MPYLSIGSDACGRVLMRDKIEEICIRYGVYNAEDVLKKRYEIIEELNTLLNDYDLNEIGLLGDTQETKVFEQILYEKNRGKISDARKGKIINKNIKRTVKCIFDCRCIQDYQIKYYIEKIAVEILNRCKVVNIYEKITKIYNKENGNWYSFLQYDYTNIKTAYELYLSVSSNEEKSDAIKRLIAGSLYVRDFVNAEKWIKVWKSESINDRRGIDYVGLWNEISDELKRLKDAIDGKQHIVLNWIDAVRYSELSYLPFVRKKINQGINFERMYAETSYTKAAMLTLLTGRRLIDEKAYGLNVWETEKTPLVTLLNEYGYKFQTYSHKFMNEGYDEECRVSQKSSYYSKNGDKSSNTSSTPSTVLQYFAVMEMANTPDKLFVIIHNLAETHPSFLNPYGKEFYFDFHVEPRGENLKERIEIIRQSQKYLDEQLEYYNQFYTNVRYNIFFSDHGKAMGENEYDIENYNHIIFGICGLDIIAKKINKVFSMNTFGKIIELLLQNKPSNISYCMKQNYAEIQRDDIYGKLIDYYSEGDEEFMDYIIQHRGVVTEADWYVRYVTGKEKYKRLDNKSLSTVEEKERIEYLRRITGKKFIDIYREPKYEKARILYEKYGWKRSEENEYI